LQGKDEAAPRVASRFVEGPHPKAASGGDQPGNAPVRHAPVHGPGEKPGWLPDSPRPCTAQSPTPSQTMHHRRRQRARRATAAAPPGHKTPRRGQLGLGDLAVPTTRTWPTTNRVVPASVQQSRTSGSAGGSLPHDDMRNDMAVAPLDPRQGKKSGPSELRRLLAIFPQEQSPSPRRIRPRSASVAEYPRTILGCVHVRIDRGEVPGTE